MSCAPCYMKWALLKSLKSENCNCVEDMHKQEQQEAVPSEAVPSEAVPSTKHKQEHKQEPRVLDEKGARAPAPSVHEA